MGGSAWLKSSTTTSDALLILNNYELGKNGDSSTVSTWPASRYAFGASYNASIGWSEVAASIERILNLNQVAPESSTISDTISSNGLIPQATPILNSDGDPIWKILIFDDLGRDIISSVLRVNDLRAWGVTIHLWVIWELRIWPSNLPAIDTLAPNGIKYLMFPFCTLWSQQQLISRS